MKDVSSASLSANGRKKGNLPSRVLAIGTLLAFVAVSSAVQVPVSIIDNAFSPDSVQIGAGDSVVWTNNGINPHTSTSGANGVPDGLWNSGTLSPGSKFTHGFATDGDSATIASSTTCSG